MLVLTRKLHEQIQIGQNITITILRVKGNAVRVGIDAPRDVRIVRSEVASQATTAPAGASAAVLVEAAQHLSPDDRMVEAGERPQRGSQESIVSRRSSRAEFLPVHDSSEGLAERVAVVCGQ